MSKFFALVVLVLLVAAPCHAELVYQSSTAVTTETADFTLLGGVTTDDTFYSGVNFELSAATRVTAIGGHFAPLPVVGDNRIFGVIVATTSLTTAPTLAQIQSGGLATTIIDLPGAFDSGTVSGAVDLLLGPGTYGIYFGSGLFGTSGEGGAVRTVTSPGFTGSVNTGGVETFAIAVSTGLTTRQRPGARFFAEGVTAVPEPSSLALSGLGLVGLVGFARRRAR